MSGYDYKKYAVLYVDDEEQSLKYFRKAFEKDFQVMTAPSAGEALGLLEKQGEQVGVLITDQRMPGQTGVDLLGLVRQSRPNIIRILTTAYSDVNSAIEAVNSGAIYKYVVKPWDIRDLRGLLMRAVEFFLVQRERDLLFREKLSVIQRIIITDRVRSLAVLAAGLSHHIRNSMTALNTFLDLAPVKLRNEISGEAQRAPEFWEDLWTLARRESQRILQMVQKVAETVIEPSPSFTGDIRPAELARRALDGIGGKVGVEVSADLPSIHGDTPMLLRLLQILVRRAVQMGGAANAVMLRASEQPKVWGTMGVQFVIQSNGPAWTDEQVASFFTAFVPSEANPQDLGLDLLAAFFIAYHHGGDILVHKGPPRGPGFELLLPCQPEDAQRPDMQQDCLEKLFAHFDANEF